MRRGSVFRMKRLLPVLALFTAAATLFVAQPASADTAWVTSPSSALPGTDISASGAGCVGNNVSVFLSAGPVIQLPADVSKTITPAVDGTWSTTMTLPGNLASGDYTLWGQCVVQFNYEPKPFTVLDPNATTTTTAPTTSTTVVATTSTVVGTTTTAAAAAANAVAVAATPNFTG